MGAHAEAFFAQLAFHEAQGPGQDFLLPGDPLGALLFFRAPVFQDDVDGRFTQTIRQRLPAFDFGAFAVGSREQLVVGRDAVDIFDNHARIEERRVVVQHQLELGREGPACLAAEAFERADAVVAQQLLDLGHVKGASAGGLGDGKSAAVVFAGFVACGAVGASGAGKTTVLNILGGMDSCSEGEIIVGGKDISKFKDKQLIEYRRHDIGFVFQFYNLVHNLTAKENVELAAQICSNPLDSETALDSVGLLERANNFPAQLSGGEQQRVSIARALAKRPKLLLCDEPTGALDYNTGRQILKLLQETCRKDKMTVVLITHNGAITPMADHIIRMKSGKIVEDIYNENPKNVEEIEW
mgnify:CR=1 FL=1